MRLHATACDKEVGICSRWYQSWSGRQPRPGRGCRRILDRTKTLSNGEGGIRTLGTLACTPVFETGPIGRSGTSPGINSRKDLRQIFAAYLDDSLLPDML